MAKLSVITDAKGNLLGAVRADAFKTKDGQNLEYRPHPDFKHHVVDVDEKLLNGPTRDLGNYLRTSMK